MVRSAIRVVVRSRPSEGVNRNLVFGQDGKTITIAVPKAQDLRSGLPADKQGQQYQFKFDGVLKESSQEEVFQVCGDESLKSALQGFNSTIMCYGQTGAGKTYTMSGGKSSFQQRGLIPRMLGKVFHEVNSLSDREVTVSIQYLEIYNESLYDLLDITTQPHEVNIFENQKGSVNVSGLRTATVGSEGEALQLLFEGEANRVIGEHQLNRESSRSHSIFMITLKMRMAGEEETVVSKINLVDLAGSERVSKTKSEGQVLKEAGHINKSLSILEQVILAASEKNRDHVPFRSSKLTHVLKDSLGGNCKTILMANIWGDANQTDETVSTCRLAQRMMRVQCEIHANFVEDTSVKSKVLQRQILELQQELAMHDAMSSRKDVVYGPYNDYQRSTLKQQVLQFLAPASSSPPEDITPLKLLSVRHMREILGACKGAYTELKAQVGSLRGLGGAGGGGEHEGGVGSAGGPGLAQQEDEPTAAPEMSAIDRARALVAGLNLEGLEQSQGGQDKANVGELDGAVQAGGVGVAPEKGEAVGGEGEDDGGASALERLMAMQGEAAPSAAHGQQDRGVPFPPNGAPSSSGAAPPGGVVPDKHQALENYKLGPGQSTAILLAENKNKLKMVRRRAKELGLNINQAKRELDGLKGKADEMKTQRLAIPVGQEGVAVMGAEEYEAVVRIKELKQEYREQFSELQMVRSEVDYTQQLCEACTKELVMGFTKWYQAHYGVTLDEAGGGGLDGFGDEDDATACCSPTGSTASSVFSQRNRTRMMAANNSSQLNSPLAKGSPSKPMARAGAPAHTATSSHLPAGVGNATQGAPPASEDASDSGAAAYYAAQQQTMARVNNNPAHRPGSIKKKQPATGFSTTSRGLTNPDNTAKQ
eukprot:gene31791-6988_t